MTATVKKSSTPAQNGILCTDQGNWRGFCRNAVTATPKAYGFVANYLKYKNFIEVSKI